MRPRSAMTIGLAVLTALALAGGPVGAARQDVPGSVTEALGSKQRTVALGVSMWDGRDISDLDGFRKSIGDQRVATWTIWSNWANPGRRYFPTVAAEAARELGAVPFIWWEPDRWPDQGDKSPISLQDIADGDYDEYITKFAEDAKAFGTRVLLRFAHQANSENVSWGWDVSPTDDNTIKSFKAAWRHVHDIFRGVGAKNVKFVWTIATQTCAGNCLKRPLGYPGNMYVDYMGFTWENWGKAPSKLAPIQDQPWVSMLKGFRPIVKRLKKVSRKPVIAAATASAPDGGSQAKWIRKGYRAVYEKLPRVKAIMWFNVDLSGPRQYHRDWTLSGWALKSYAAIAARSEFKGRIH